MFRYTNQYLYLESSNGFIFLLYLKPLCNRKETRGIVAEGALH